MSFNIEITSNFKKELKRLLKKYPSLKNEFKILIENLELNPFMGKQLGNKCYKIRVSIKSKGKGKSGGARIITHIIVEEKNIYLLSIYDKSNQENITDKKILQLINDL